MYEEIKHEINGKPIGDIALRFIDKGRQRCIYGKDVGYDNIAAELSDTSNLELSRRVLFKDNDPGRFLLCMVISVLNSSFFPCHFSLVSTP